MPHTLKRFLYVSIFIIVLIVGLLFFVKNNQPVEFHYIAGSKELPVSMLMLGTLCLGVILGVLALLPMLIKARHQKAKLEKQIKMTEKEVNNLRVMPVKNPH